jgi:hypothetical protein
VDFLPSVLSETQNYLNSANMIYLNDITTKIVKDSEIIGFVCENLNPIRFVGVLDFGVDSDAYEEYMTSNGMSSLTFIYNDDIITIPSVSVGDEETTKPYVSTNSDFILRQNENKIITIIGGNFDDSVKLEFGPEVTINGFDFITDQRMDVNVTAGSNNQVGTDIIVTKGNSHHFGNTPTIKVIDSAIGTGPSGTYLWGFPSGGTGLSAFDGNWTLEVFGDINSPDDFFMTSDAGTPSNGTGPSAPYDSYYLFGEKSSPNYGAGNYAQMSTSYFRQLTELSFYYHMYGDGIGALVVQSKDDDGVWTEQWRRDGQQNLQDDPFIYTGTLNASSWDAVAIRFVFEDGGSYDGDIAIDNIKIVSI